MYSVAFFITKLTSQNIHTQNINCYMLTICSASRSTALPLYKNSAPHRHYLNSILSLTSLHHRVCIENTSLCTL